MFCKVRAPGSIILEILSKTIIGIMKVDGAIALSNVCAVFRVSSGHGRSRLDYFGEEASFLPEKYICIYPKTSKEHLLSSSILMQYHFHINIFVTISHQQSTFPNCCTGIIWERLKKKQ